MRNIQTKLIFESMDELTNFETISDSKLLKNKKYLNYYNNEESTHFVINNISKIIRSNNNKGVKIL